MPLFIYLNPGQSSPDNILISDPTAAVQAPNKQWRCDPQADETRWSWAAPAVPIVLLGLLQLYAPTPQWVAEYPIDAPVWQGQPVASLTLGLPPSASAPATPSWRYDHQPPVGWQGSPLPASIISNFVQLYGPSPLWVVEYPIDSSPIWQGNPYPQPPIVVALSATKIFDAGGQAPTKQWRYDHDASREIWVWSAPNASIISSFVQLYAPTPQWVAEYPIDAPAWQGQSSARPRVLAAVVTSPQTVGQWRYDYQDVGLWQAGPLASATAFLPKGSVVVDFGIAAEIIASARNDAIAVGEILIRSSSDRSGAAEVMLSAAADAEAPSELTALRRADAIALAENLSAAIVDRGAAVESALGVNVGDGYAIEVALTIRGERAAAIETMRSVIGVTADGLINIETAAALAIGHASPAETSVAAIIAAGTLIENLVSVLRDHSQPIEIVVTLVDDSGALSIENLISVLQAQPQPLEIMVTLAADVVLPQEQLGIRIIHSDGILNIEILNPIAADQVAALSTRMRQSYAVRIRGRSGVAIKGRQ